MMQVLRRAHVVLFFLALVVLLGQGGCGPVRQGDDLNFSYYSDRSFQWRYAGRLLILPLVNETAFAEASEQMRRSLSAELQQLGLFEVVVTPPDVEQRLAQVLRDGGRFDEGEIINLARVAGADVIVAGTLSHYTPYFRPRIGLTLQAVSPDLGKVVASVDGLWDANNLDVADRARRHYTRRKTAYQVVADHVHGTMDDAYGAALALESPHLFQRFVASEAARLLVGDPALLAALRPAPPSHFQPRPAFQWKGCTTSKHPSGTCKPAAKKAPPSDAAARGAKPVPAPRPAGLTPARSPTATAKAPAS